MTASNLKRPVRNKLMFKDPHCYWCGREVVYYHIVGGGSHPKHFATIDHLYSKYDPRRKIIKPGEQRWVLSCHECNELRAIEERKVFESKSR